jgi:hypothetical protein
VLKRNDALPTFKEFRVYQEAEGVNAAVNFSKKALRRKEQGVAMN